jgi:hypothetical protein
MSSVANPAAGSTDSTRRATSAYTLAYEEKTGRDGSKKVKLLLPPAPGLDDHAGQCAWLTAVFGLHVDHPIINARLVGVHGPMAHAIIDRRGAPPLRFEPVTRLNTPTKLIESLAWATIDKDSPVPGLTGEHCRVICHVVKLLAATHETITQEQDTAKIVGTFLHTAMQAEQPVTSYGKGPQRYEAAVALRRDIHEATGRPWGPPRYAYDSNTGELLVPVSDLQEAARRYMGSSLRHGELDARMELLGWERVVLDGHQRAGKEGRAGPHACLGIYRGHLPGRDDDETVSADTRLEAHGHRDEGDQLTNPFHLYTCARETQVDTPRVLGDGNAWSVGHLPENTGLSAEGDPNFGWSPSPNGSKGGALSERVPTAIDPSEGADPDLSFLEAWDASFSPGGIRLREHQ